VGEQCDGTAARIRWSKNGVRVRKIKESVFLNSCQKERVSGLEKDTELVERDDVPEAVNDFVDVQKARLEQLQGSQNMAFRGAR
jgi:hypothetical protein